MMVPLVEMMMELDKMMRIVRLIVRVGNKKVSRPIMMDHVGDGEDDHKVVFCRAFIMDLM